MGGRSVFDQEERAEEPSLAGGLHGPTWASRLAEAAERRRQALAVMLPEGDETRGILRHLKPWEPAGGTPKAALLRLTPAMRADGAPPAIESPSPAPRPRLRVLRSRRVRPASDI